MAHARLIESFPRRPIGFVGEEGRGRKRRITLIVILLLFLPGLYWGWSLWQDQQLREFLRANGAQAEVLDSQGSCWSRRQITGDEPRGCNLEISYRLQPEHGGSVLEADVWLDGAQPIFTPPALYDPADPSRVMLKPEAERDRGWREWIGVPIALAIPLAALVVWLLTRRNWLEEALRDPRPVTVPVDRLVRTQAGLEVWFNEQEGGKERLHFFPHGRTPFLVPAPSEAVSDRPWALALLASNGRPILVDSALSELDLTAEERAALLGR